MQGAEVYQAHHGLALGVLGPHEVVRLNRGLSRFSKKGEEALPFAYISPQEKMRTYLSSSDEFLLKPTRANNRKNRFISANGGRVDLQVPGAS